jgi:hypothetical protein
MAQMTIGDRPEAPAPKWKKLEVYPVFQRRKGFSRSSEPESGSPGTFDFTSHVSFWFFIQPDE